MRSKILLLIMYLSIAFSLTACSTTRYIGVKLLLEQEKIEEESLKKSYLGKSSEAILANFGPPSFMHTQQCKWYYAELKVKDGPFVSKITKQQVITISFFDNANTVNDIVVNSSLAKYIKINKNYTNPLYNHSSATGYFFKHFIKKKSIRKPLEESDF